MSLRAFGGAYSIQCGGLLGPLTGRLGLQAMGAAGYGLVFPVACLLVTLVLRRRLQNNAEPPDASVVPEASA